MYLCHGWYDSLNHMKIAYSDHANRAFNHNACRYFGKYDIHHDKDIRGVYVVI